MILRGCFISKIVLNLSFRRVLNLSFRQIFVKSVSLHVYTSLRQRVDI